MSSSSKRWLDRQHKDPFVKQAKKEGFRSRAVYKLIEIQEKDRLIRPGMTVLDLGAAPGGWSQLAQDWVGPKGCIVGVDLLPISPMGDIHFIEGDFTDPDIQLAILEACQDRPIDVIICDMAPNMSGNKTVDQLKFINLLEAAVHFARTHLAPKGHFIAKVFEGSGLQDVRQDMKTSFKSVASRKPKASRDASRECYLVAKEFKRI